VVVVAVRLAETMRKLFMVLSIVALVVAVLAVVAYRGSLLRHEGLKATKISSPLEFSIQLDKAEFKLGELINVTFTLRNISNNTVSLSWGNGLILDFSINDANGTLIWQWSWNHAHIDAVIDITLEPGQRLSDIFPHIATFYWWDQMIWDNQVPKGTYFINGIVPNVSVFVEGEAVAQDLSYETPSISFTIN
jgi:hypothetical protein